jgi:hypothetical protein
LNASFNCSNVTFIPVSLVRVDRFFISKFHYAKSDFKYSDQFLSDQRAALFLKIIKIIKLCFFGSDRELKHTLRYHLNATKRGAEAMGTKESENARQREACRKSEPFSWVDAD